VELKPVTSLTVEAEPLRFATAAKFLMVCMLFSAVCCFSASKNFYVQFFVFSCYFLLFLQISNADLK